MAKNRTEKKNTDTIVPTDLSSIEQLEYSWKILERTDSWINNCDTKIGILAGIVGVMITIGLTTDAVVVLWDFFVELFNNIIQLELKSILYLIPVAAELFFISIFIFHLLKAIVANIDAKKFEQEGLKTNSNLYFGSIAGNTFKEFKKKITTDNLQLKKDDVLSQIYINSAIAQMKYHHYNKAIFWMVLVVVGISMNVILAVIIF